jgi:Fe2+ or Zn2+ uptake regulation protein
MEMDFLSILRQAGLRVTKPRLALLEFLARQKRPVGLRRIAAHMRSMNLATVYRAVEALLEAGILRACEVGHGHLDYELAHLPHHHHVICTTCGKIEEIAECASEKNLHTEALRAAKQFACIEAHQATFYGVCKTCA